MDISALPAANYSIILFAGIITGVCFFIAVFLHKVDAAENEKCKVEFFQEYLGQNETLYSISMTIKESICRNGLSDIIFRLRGTFKDSPLILYREEAKKKFNNHLPLNLGIAIPFNLGHLLEVDIACDNDCCEENEPVLGISDIYIRELPRQRILEMEEDRKASRKSRIISALFNTCGQDTLAWVCLKTVTNSAEQHCASCSFQLTNSCLNGRPVNTPSFPRADNQLLIFHGLKLDGAGILGLPKLKNGTTHTLRAREACLSLQLTREDEKTKKRAKISYKSLHYLLSLFPQWHDIWSDFSALDQLLVIFLDLITGMVVVSAAYAFALEEYLGAYAIIAVLVSSLPSVSFTAIEEFNLFRFFSGASKEWLLQNSLNLVHVVWIAWVVSLISIPMSLLWCRLFRFIGGKGFNSSSVKKLDKPRKPSVFDETNKGFHCHKYSERNRNATSLMLRTLESRSVHTDSGVTSSRRLRVEPLISNCPPDNVTARSIAYLRTKMAKLREDDFGMAALGEPKVSKVLHESHTQSTDAPQMPMPSSGPDGKGEVVGVARYCQRLVQQAKQHIRDRSVIAECYEVVNDKSTCESSSASDPPRRLCCPQKYSYNSHRCRHESFSNTTFFTEEDAASVKEMISKFSLLNVANVPEVQLNDSDAQSSTQCEHIESDDYEEDLSRSTLETETSNSVPAPSAGIFKTIRRKKRHVQVKNSGSETRTYKNSGDQTTNKPPSKLSNHAKRVMASPIIQIGWGRKIKLETCNAQEKLKFHDKNVPRHYNHKDAEKSKTEKRTAPVPSGYSLSAITNSTMFESDSKEVVDYRWQSEKKQEIRLKGPRFKLVAFFLIAFVQFMELYFVTGYENPTKNHFYKSNEDTGSHPRPGRMHAALLSCIIFVFLYFLVTIHLIALISFAIEFVVYCWISRKMNNGASCDYDEQYSGAYSV